MHARKPGRLVNVGVVAGVVLAVVVTALLVPVLEASFSSARPASRISAAWSTSKAALGDRATIRGRVTSKRITTRTVSLYLSTLSGWRPVASTHTGPRGYYTMKVPTTFYFSRPMQLRARPTSRAAGATSANKTFTVVPRTAPRGAKGGWAPAKAGVEQRFNPCATVSYRTSPLGAGSGATADVKAAFALATQATGIKFRQVSQTASTPRSNQDFPAGTDIIVTWDTPEGTRGAMAPDTLSYSRVFGTRRAHDAHGSVRRVVHAGIVLNKNFNSVMVEPKPAQTRMRVRILMHEIGAVLGLGPVTAEHQRMHENVYDVDVAEWGAGDLAGLRKVGLVEGCVTDN
jgi:hypothetical protein